MRQPSLRLQALPKSVCKSEGRAFSSVCNARLQEWRTRVSSLLKEHFFLEARGSRLPPRAPARPQPRRDCCSQPASSASLIAQAVAAPRRTCSPGFIRRGKAFPSAWRRYSREKFN